MTDETSCETPQNGARDRQTEAANGSRQDATAKRCVATARSGAPCKAHPLAGSDRCSLHTPGLASDLGRRGGLIAAAPCRRRRPWRREPPPRRSARRPQCRAARHRRPDTNPMTAREVRVYMEKLTRMVAGGRLDPALARAATTAAATWLRAIAMDEKTAAIEKRIAALEKLAGPEKTS